LRFSPGDLLATGLFLVIDVGMFNAGIVLAFYLRFLGPPDPVIFQSYEDITRYVLILPAVAFWAGGLYGVKWHSARIEDLMIVIRSVAVALAGLVFVTYYFRGDLPGNFPPTVFVLSFGTSSVLLCGWRLLLREVVGKRMARQQPPRRLVIVGLGGLENDTVERLSNNDFPRYEVVGYIEKPARRRHDAERAGRERILGAHLKRLGDMAQFPRIMDDARPDIVLVSPNQLTHEEVIDILTACELRGIEYRILPSFLDMLTSRANIELVNYTPIIHFGPTTIEGWNALFKRLMDVTFSAVGLLVLTPFLVVVGVMIVLDSTGGPLFIQTRTGKNQRRFKMIKFRTMFAHAPDGPPLTQANDSRITRVGRWLRRYSIDELPQLANVLVGDMSLVGPRAVVPYVADRFSEMERLTLKVRPGMTGLAQVSGRDELGFREKSLLSLYYIKNYSLLLDVKILLQTIRVVLSGVGTDGTRLD